MPHTETALAVHDLSFNYQKSLVFEKVNLSLQAGELAFLVGPNGSGKTTLLRCLAGWSTPKSGSISLLGEEFTGAKQSQKQSVCFVPDSPAFYDDLTAREHLRFVLNARGRQDCAEHAEDLLERFGLLAQSDNLPSSFSRGMREKLALVIALAVRPRLLMLDEPFGPLDRASAKLLSREIFQITSQGTAVIVSVHQKVPDITPNIVWKLEDTCLKLAENTSMTSTSSAS